MTGTLPANFLASFQDLAILGLAFNEGMFVHFHVQFVHKSSDGA